MPDLRWHDLRSTAATILLQAGFNPKAVSKVMGHSSEILTVDYYGDNRKIAAVKLEKLDEYIESVRPDRKKPQEKNDFRHIKIDVSEFFE